MLVPDFYEGNPEPTFALLRVAGVRLVGLKVSEGLTFEDRRWRARARRARVVGMRRLYYHFARPDLHPMEHGAQEEADHFVRCVAGGLRRHDLLALDLERGEPHFRLLEAWARAFNHRVRARLGRWPGFYASRYYADAIAPGRPIGSFLWLADYGPNDGTRHPAAPPHPWRRVALHQFTSRGHLLGARGDVDLSYSAGL